MLHFLGQAESVFEHQHHVEQPIATSQENFPYCWTLFPHGFPSGKSPEGCKKE